MILKGQCCQFSLIKRLSAGDGVTILSIGSPAQIVACYLQRLCLVNGLNPNKFELPYSKTLISSRLRIELETLSRTLKSLRNEGIEVNGTSVSFTDKQKIGRFVCNHCSLSEDCQVPHFFIKQQTHRFQN
jgi:hypothetical protein